MSRREPTAPVVWLALALGALDLVLILILRRAIPRWVRIVRPIRV